MLYKKLPLIVISSYMLSGCQVGYLIKNGYHQAHLLYKAEPIEKFLNDPSLNQEEKDKILLAQKAHDFAESELGLATTNNYRKFVKLEKPYVTWTVSASPKNKLEHYSWTFPIVGSVPYKGFFTEDEALKEQDGLQKENLDTYVRGVSAYSTLGWFNDPLLSSMLRYKSHDLVNTIIHETVHATLFIKSSADFNERLATFLGNKGTELYYLKYEGEKSETLKMIQLENEDDALFSIFISKKLKELNDFYANNKYQGELDRELQFEKIKSDFKNDLLPKLKTENYLKFTEIKLNNARLLVYKTYMEDLSDFEALYKKTNKDFKKMLKLCKGLEKSKHPEVDLKNL